jgi:hypothetical protein
MSPRRSKPRIELLSSRARRLFLRVLRSVSVLHRRLTGPTPERAMKCLHL